MPTDADTACILRLFVTMEESVNYWAKLSEKVGLIEIMLLVL